MSRGEKGIVFKLSVKFSIAVTQPTRAMATEVAWVDRLLNTLENLKRINENKHGLISEVNMFLNIDKVLYFIASF